MSNFQKGFIGLGALIAIVLGLIVIGGGAYYVIHQNTSPATQSNYPDISTQQTQQRASNTLVQVITNTIASALTTALSVGTVHYVCADGKSISATYVGFDVSLKLSDGRTLELTEGAVAASYPGMPPYYVSKDGSIMFGASKDKSFSLDESTTTFSTFQETYKDCR